MGCMNADRPRPRQHDHAAHRLAVAALAVAVAAMSGCVSCAHYPAPPADAREDAYITPEAGGTTMGSFTFTANATTNQLTITAHGLTTGDGPAAVRNIGGALPSPLVPVTDVFIIRDDADHLKLATSNANALAGTFIDLTTAGSGTNILEIGLPYRVPRIAAAGGQIKSADMNATWASLVALYDLLTGQAQAIWSSLRVAVATTFASATTFEADITVNTNATIAGTTTTSGALAVNGSMVLGTISPILSSGNNNNFNPTGLSGATVIYAGAGAAAAITGLAGGVNGRLIYIVNVSGFAVTITNLDANSTSANRILTPSATTLTLTGSNGFAVVLVYDGAAGFWRVIGKNF